MPNHVFSHLEFEDTTIEDWLVMQDALGLTRGVLVQSMMYGHNYELALHGLARFPDRLRAVIAPWPGITDRELEILTRAGVVGARFAARLDAALDERMIHRVHEFGWSANYLGIGEHRRKTILASPGRFVIEHAGHVPPAQGTDSAAFKFLLQCLDTGRCWIKLNPRFSAAETFPFADIAPIVKQARRARAQPPGVVHGLAASAVFPADAERRRPRRHHGSNGFPTKPPATASSSTTLPSFTTSRRPERDASAQAGTGTR